MTELLACEIRRAKRPVFMRVVQHPYFWLVFAWAALHIGALVAGIAPLADGNLGGPDSYMRSIRVMELMSGWDWYSSVIPRSNAPFGETIHWTRLFDLIILSGAVPLSQFMDLRSAILWAGGLSSPLLHLALAFAIIWAARPIAAKGRIVPLVIAAMALLLQPPLFNYALAGWADHHVLLFLLAVLLFGAIIRVLAGEPGVPHAGKHPLKRALTFSFVGGVLAAFGLWASPELLIAIIPTSAAMASIWLAAGPERQRILLFANLVFAVVFTLFLAGVLLAERGTGDFLTPTYDRVSVVHLYLAGLLAGLWCVLALWSQLFSGRLVAHWIARLVVGGLAATGFVAALYGVFPAFFKGPLAEVDPRILPIWLNHVTEVAPLWPDTRAELGRLIQMLGTSALALPWLIYRLIAEKNTSQRAGWVCVLLGLALAIPLSILHVRFVPYAAVLSTIVLADLIGVVAAYAVGWRWEIPRVLARVGLPAMLFLVPLAAGSSMAKTDAKVKSASSGTVQSGDRVVNAAMCDLRSLTKLLNTSPDFAEPKTILMMLDYGPEVLFRTRHHVVATPYHRNGQAIYETYRALATPWLVELSGTALKRKIDFVVLCPNALEQSFFGRDRMALYHRLLKGQMPNWLKKRPVSEALAKKVIILQVDRTALAQNAANKSKAGISPKQ